MFVINHLVTQGNRNAKVAGTPQFPAVRHVPEPTNASRVTQHLEALCVIKHLKVPWVSRTLKVLAPAWLGKPSQMPVYQEVPQVSYESEHSNVSSPEDECMYFTDSASTPSTPSTPSTLPEKGSLCKGPHFLV